MTTLSEKQLKSLSTLWSAISVDMRDKLRAAAGPSGQLADIFASLDADADDVPAYDKTLFRIFADVTGNADLPPTHARFSAAELELVTELAGLDDLTAPGSASEEAGLQAWRGEGAEAVAALIDRADGDKTLKRRLVTELGDDYAVLLKDAEILLAHDDVLYAALRPFPDTISDLDEELVAAARDAHEQICDEAPDASLWFLKILTARLERTAHIFRVVEKIGRRSDDALVSKTDLADIGDLVLANASFYADCFATPPQSLAEAEIAGKAVAEFVKVSVGMTREFGIRKDGHWGKTLFAVRAKASAALEAFFKQVEKTVPRALPHPVKGQRGLSRPGPLPKPEIIDQAEAALCLLAATGDWASQAAVGSAQKQAADMVRNELDECARDLLEILRAAEGEDSDLAAEGIALVVRYMRAFADTENADLIQRRSVAVRANAA